MNSTSSPLRPALVLFGALTLVVGLLYPLAVTGIGKLAFNDQAGGSLVVRDGAPVGSRLIGQSFQFAQLFLGHGRRPPRPCRTMAAGSGGSNLGPTNPALLDAVKARIADLRAADPGNTAAIPVDLVTASASGLDPEISLAAARYQLARVARARHLDPAIVQTRARCPHHHARLRRVRRSARECASIEPCTG